MRHLSKKGLRILVIQPTSGNGDRAQTLNLTTGRHRNKDFTLWTTKEPVPKVLLVEDTEDNRQMMRKLLEMSGFQVVEAVNGREAVEVASRVKPQIILMDLSLPFIDGLAATRQIRSLPA